MCLCFLTTLQTLNFFNIFHIIRLLKSFISLKYLAWCKSGIRTPRPGTPQQSLTVGPDNISSLFDLLCSRQIYIYIYIYIYSRIIGILSYTICSELIHHFREIFNVTLGVPNLVGDGEIHATCLASNLPDNS